MSISAKRTIVAVIAYGILAGWAGAAVEETWESAPLQAVFDGAADRVWVGDIEAYAIEPGNWPDGLTVFGGSATKAIRSANITATGQYTIVTDVTDEVDPTRLIEWTVYVSGNSIAIQSGYWFQAVLLANTADVGRIESPDAAFAGYRLTASRRTVEGTSSNWLTLWKCSTADSGWVPLAEADLGSAFVSHGWNLKVARMPSGEWTVSHARGGKGGVPEVDFVVTDTSVDLSSGDWWAGMTWITKATSHSNKFGFDDFRVEASQAPNVPPVADAGGDQTVTDVDADGFETVTLDGSGSMDIDGTIVSDVWTTGDTTLATQAVADVVLGVGVHEITLTVTDDAGATDTDSIVVTVMPGGPWPPTADAGPDQSVRDSDGSGWATVTLDGSGSSDLGGAIVAYTWTKDGAVIATGETAEIVLAVGVHTITLEVVDDDGLSDTDTVVVTVHAVGPTTDQISQYGITWTFSEPVEYGQFITGDYWVIGPVTIVSVDPAPADGQHGSMLNPSIGDGQAYDAGSNNYRADAGVSFPVTLTGNTSLVSTCSWTDGADIHQDLTGHNIAASTCNIRDAAVLTVLSDVPPADAFRPPYADTDKRLFRRSDLRYDLLPRLAPPNTSPDYDYEDARWPRDPSKTVAEQYGRLVQRPWLLHMTDWSGRSTHPTENMPGYHREVYNALSVCAVLLLMDLPDIDNILIGYVQLGIDSYGVIATGAGGNASDADSSIAHWPVLLAGLLLDDEAMKTNTYRYRSRWMTYYIADGISPYESAIVPAGDTYHGYAVGWRQNPGTQEHEHLDPATEWHLVSDGGGSKRESYRGINSRSWPGFALAARVMNATAYWNDPAFFDYVDRWMVEEPTDYGNSSVGATSSSFVSDVWDTYRPAAATGDFNGDGVLTAADIDLMTGMIRSAMPQPRFDLTGDGTVDAADLAAYVRDVLGTELGDANLDGRVDLDDFVILKTGFGGPGGWADGDFDGNGVVDLDDFVILKTYFGFTAP